jgi:HAD superfamily hydrolase (TIGR01509 family)
MNLPVQRWPHESKSGRGGLVGNQLRIFRQRLFQIMAKELRPVAGVREVLSALGTRRCVASNGDPDEIVFRLKTCGLDVYFDGAIFSGTQVPRSKPYPDVFLAAAQAFNVDPARCVVIEDSVTGVTAARAAGMRVFGHAALTATSALANAGAIPFTSMSELPSLLSSGAV